MSERFELKTAWPTGGARIDGAGITLDEEDRATAGLAVRRVSLTRAGDRMTLAYAADDLATLLTLRGRLRCAGRTSALYARCDDNGAPV